MKSVLRVLVTLLNVALLAICVMLLWPATSPADIREPQAPTANARAWAPPSWLPPTSRDALWVLESLDSAPLNARGPRIRSPSAIVADLDRGEVLWARDADSPRTVASLTKVVSGLAMVTEPLDLDRELCVSSEVYPTRSGARSRFETGVCHSGWDYVGAALVASDNRGAMAMPLLAGLRYETFIARMNQVSADLRMQHATWADPAGLEDENMATARDMLKATVAASTHPTLSLPGSAPRWRIERRHGPHVLGSTNRLARRFDTLMAKTGYTDTAKYCFATVVRTASGARLAVVVLGAPTVAARFSDTSALIEWAEAQSP